MAPYMYLFTISSIFSFVTSILYFLAICNFLRNRQSTVSEGTLETTESTDRFWSVVPFDFTDGASLATLLNKDDDDYFWTVEHVLPGYVVLSRPWEGGDYVDSDEDDDDGLGDGGPDPDLQFALGREISRQWNENVVQEMASAKEEGS